MIIHIPFCKVEANEVLELKEHTHPIISTRFLTRVRKLTVIYCCASTEIFEQVIYDRNGLKSAMISGDRTNVCNGEVSEPRSCHRRHYLPSQTNS